MTPKEAQLLAFIERHQAETGTTPSYRQIAAHLGLKARSNVSRLVNQLVAKRELAHDPERKRDLRVLRNDIRHAAELVLQSIRNESLETNSVVVSAEAIGRLDLALAETSARPARQEVTHG